MRRTLVWLLALFVVSFVASTATANVNIAKKSGAVMDVTAEESSFAVSSANHPAMEAGQVETANTADEDGASIGSRIDPIQPIDGEMKQTAAMVGEVTANAANKANLCTATTTTEKNPVDVASSSTAAVDYTTNAAQYVTTKSTLNQANPQDAVTANTQSEVWAPNDIAGADITPAMWDFEGTAVPIGSEVVVVIKWTTPATWTNAQS